MNYSNVFANAHAQAKYTRAFFPSYRGAFSVALSQIMRQAWAEFKNTANIVCATIAEEIKLISLPTISKAAAEAMKTPGDHIALIDQGGVYVSLRDDKEAGLTLSLFNAEKSMTTQYHKVSGLDDTKAMLDTFALLVA